MYCEGKVEGLGLGVLSKMGTPIVSEEDDFSLRANGERTVGLLCRSCADHFFSVAESFIKEYRDARFYVVLDHQMECILKPKLIE
jgi:hypothetical protein